MKKDPIVLSAKQGASLLPAITKQLDALEKVMSTCLKEKMSAAAGQIATEIKLLQNLEGQIQEFIGEDKG